MNSFVNLIKEIKQQADPKRAKISQWFFKTGPGQYGEGDKFVGLTVPAQRKIAKKYFRDLTLKDISKLLESKIHEQRFVALEALVMKFEHADEKQQKQIASFYLKHAKKINNWDLVDTSAPYILGTFLLIRPRKVLKKMARSTNLWEKRIAIVSTAKFIEQNQFEDTLAIARLLLKDDHDLIHKAIGWMLREVGKRDQKILEIFLKQNYSDLPRTTLRYAIERFPESKRQKYLKMRVK